MPDTALPAIGTQAARAPDAPDPAWNAHLRRQQLILLARQSTRSPYAVAVPCLFVAFIAWRYASPVLIVGWVVALLGLLFGRRPYATSLLRNPPVDADRALRNLVWFGFAHGALIGTGAILFFFSLPAVDRAVLTMVLVCWTAGGIASAAAYAPAFYFYATPALVPVAIVWALSGNAQTVVIGIMIVIFWLYEIFFVRDIERVVQESVFIRHENERLLTELERERQEVSLARDRAEAASRAKSRFLAAASHDLRQPLHALALYGAALSVHARDGIVGEIAREIDKALSSLTALLDSLLDISKLDAGAVRAKHEPVNIRQLLERVETDYRPVAQEKGLEFRVGVVDAYVNSDAGLLERIVRNLVDNAVKYTPSGTITLNADRGNGTVRITVRDTGIGIARAERERIFEEFYQIGNPERDRTQGLGLGLAIVRRLAHLLGVQVDVESDAGRGSVFSVTLPVAADIAPAAAASSRSADAEAQRLTGLHVLVIDDEPAVRLGMRTLLESWGCRVVTCSGYAEVERFLEEHGLEVELIIADFRLREHENGIDTIRRLRERVGNVPALLVTGDTGAERLQEAQASGLPLLHKPVAAEHLRRTMISVMR